MTDTRIAELLDELTPSYDDRHGDWERVAAGARPTRRHPNFQSVGLRVGVLAVAIAAAGALVLAWPFASERGSVLDRALAAVGNGPVLHVVLRGEWGGTLVDLSNGKRIPVYGDDEIWYDTASGRTHSIERLGGVVQDEELVGQTEKPSAELAALGREYRQALQSGTARITGEDTIDGEPVVWVTVHSELLPDVADGKTHEWAQQVAVSKRTYKPVALRETRDGRPGPGTLQRVLTLALIARDEADFTTSRPSLNGTAFRQSREQIPLTQAPAVLGRTPLWLGSTYAGLPLTRIYRETTSVGHQHRVRLTGAKAAAAIKCSERRSGDGDCLRALGLTSVDVRPDGVFTSEGPIEWSDQHSDLVFYYGTVADDPTTSRADSIPMFNQPYVSVTESLQASQFRRGAGTYVPPEGSIFIAAEGHIGFLQKDGIQVGIDAGSASALIAAARTLAQVPPG
jgi:hypothetical protein